MAGEENEKKSMQDHAVFLSFGIGASATAAMTLFRPDSHLIPSFRGQHFDDDVIASMIRNSGFTNDPNSTTRRSIRSYPISNISDVSNRRVKSSGGMPSHVNSTPDSADYPRKSVQQRFPDPQIGPDMQPIRCEEDGDWVVLTKVPPKVMRFVDNKSSRIMMQPTRSQNVNQWLNALWRTCWYAKSSNPDLRSPIDEGLSMRGLVMDREWGAIVRKSAAIAKHLHLPTDTSSLPYDLIRESLNSALSHHSAFLFDKGYQMNDQFVTHWTSMPEHAGRAVYPLVFPTHVSQISRQVVADRGLSMISERADMQPRGREVASTVRGRGGVSYMELLRKGLSDVWRQFRVFFQ